MVAWLVRAHHWHPTARATPVCFTEAGHSACKLVLVELEGADQCGRDSPAGASIDGSIMFSLRTVVATMAAKYLTPTLAGNRSRNAKPSPFAATSKAEVNQHRKYNAPVATMNPPPTFVAIAFNDFGGIGLEFYTSVVKP